MYEKLVDETTYFLDSLVIPWNFFPIFGVIELLIGYIIIQTIDKDMKDELDMNANLLVEFLQKPSAEFTKADIVSYIKEKNIRMVNFMYPAGDGRLKTLNFVINNAAYLDAILTCGERVDGSSLFSFIEAGSSDLYVIPRFRTAFIDPFSELPTLSMLCSFFNKDGEPLESSPEYTLHKASKAFSDVTGMQFEAMGELEYYVIADEEDLFPATDQRGYHESGPYAKFNQFRTQCMQYIAQAGGQIKYGHSEVGNFTLNSKIYEQNEIDSCLRGWKMPPTS